MYFDYDRYSFELKERFANIKKILIILILTCAVLSMVYFLYSALVFCDDFILEYTSKYFLPLANFLCHGQTTEIYKQCAIKLMGFIIPLYALYFYSDKKEEDLLKKHYELLELKEKKKQIQKALEKEKEFDSIKEYSICLSLDCKSEKQISEIKKVKINNIIFSKLKDLTVKFPAKITFNLGNVMILSSSDFCAFDYIYKNITDFLLKYKKILKEKLNLTMCANITTDAYNKKPSDEEIIKNHFEIKSCIHENRFVSTSTFSKKYKHLRKSVYAGSPIGQYIFFDKDKSSKDFELNIISKF